MSEPAEFPFPADVTADERATARSLIGAWMTIVEETPRGIRFEGRPLGQTGPIWHYQYTRVYALAHGFLAAGHDLRTGITVIHAEALDTLAVGFGNEGVREFVEDELRFRGLLGAHAST